MNHCLKCPFSSFLGVLEAVSKETYVDASGFLILTKFLMVAPLVGQFCSILGDALEDPSLSCSFSPSNDLYKHSIPCINLCPD